MYALVEPPIFLDYAMKGRELAVALKVRMPR
jgi:hypothetical protein